MFIYRKSSPIKSKVRLSSRLHQKSWECRLLHGETARSAKRAAWKRSATKQVHAREIWGSSMELMLMRIPSRQQEHTHTHTQSHGLAHIPLGWSKERKCESCQPIGDWVMDEFDSERNILLPWWWTRRNDSWVHSTKKTVGIISRKTVERDRVENQDSRFVETWQQASEPQTQPTRMQRQKTRPQSCIWPKNFKQKR